MERFDKVCLGCLFVVCLLFGLLVLNGVLR